MNINTEKQNNIELTPLRITDAQGVFQLWSDKDATYLTNWPYFTEFKDSFARLEKCLKYYENPLHFGAYAIRSSENNFIGIAGADVMDELLGTYDVWYFLKRDHWGQGLAKKTVSELLKIMRNSGRARVACATAVTENTASWKTLEHHGFKKTGLLQGGHKMHNQNLDLFQYSLDLEN